MIEIEFDRRELLTDWQYENHTLLVGVLVTIGDAEPTPVMLDIGSEVCVISRSWAERTGWVYSPGLISQRISTRLGLYDGVIDRIAVTFAGANDTQLVIDATWLIIEDWTGPIVFGWRGGMERMRFAIDPLDNWFYFASA